MKKILSAVLVSAAFVSASAQNPYIPLWEHIPDGEAYVFEDPDRPGHGRVYVYGSHDIIRTDYCGRDQVVWSAPVEDLSAWRYDGVIFTSWQDAEGRPLRPDSVADVLFAPDVVETVENGRKVYYLCPNNQAGGRQNMIARAERPDGPFRVCNWNADGKTTKGVFGFDPAIFRDDDGRVYGYWGYEKSYAAELDPATMCTLKPGTKVVEDMISNCKQPGKFRFFEASSMRKIQGKYVFVYSRITEDGEFGLPSTNYTLAYAYSDSPLGPFTYGGTIIDCRGRDTDEAGRVIVTGYRNGNTHGTLQEIGGKWYVFYHRQSGDIEYARQAMVAPVDVRVEQGRVIIREAEMTSEGFQIGGLDPLRRWPAGIACYLTGPRPMEQHYPHFKFYGSYVAATYPGDEGMDASYSLNTHHAPLVNNTDSSTAGYKYFDFTPLQDKSGVSLCLEFQSSGVAGEIDIMADSPWTAKGGRLIGTLALDGKDTTSREYAVPLGNIRGMTGRHAVYLKFRSTVKGQSLGTLYSLIFRTSDKE